VKDGLVNKYKKKEYRQRERENRQHPVSGFFRPVIQKSPTTITNQSIEKSPITGTRVRFFVGQGQS
jgi:hypothetical protein